MSRSASTRKHSSARVVFISSYLLIVFPFSFVDFPERSLSGRDRRVVAISGVHTGSGSAQEASGGLPAQSSDLIRRRPRHRDDVLCRLFQRQIQSPGFPAALLDLGAGPTVIVGQFAIEVP